MKKNQTVIVDGISYDIAYEKSESGGRYDVEISDEYLKKYLTETFTFYKKDNECFFLITNDKIGKIGSQIGSQIIIKEQNDK